MKIAILGYSGGGKSYLAKRLGAIYNIPVMHIDEVKYDKAWNAKEPYLVLPKVHEFMQKESWIIDGNYSSIYQEERLENADVVIIININRVRCLLSCLKREKEYKKQGYVNSLNLGFIWFVLFGGRTEKRKEHYKNIFIRYQNKAIVFKSRKQINAYIKECEKRYEAVCKQNGDK